MERNMTFATALPPRGLRPCLKKETKPINCRGFFSLKKKLIKGVEDRYNGSLL
jgi:hypothetical protein